MFVFKTSKWLEYVIKIPVTLLCNVSFETDLAGGTSDEFFVLFYKSISLLSVQISVLTAVR